MCIRPVAAGVVGVSSPGACARAGLCAGKKRGDGTVLVVLDGVTVLPTKGTSLGAWEPRRGLGCFPGTFCQGTLEGPGPRSTTLVFRAKAPLSSCPSSLAGCFPPASVARCGAWECRGRKAPEAG